MPIIHITIFKFASTASPADISAAYTRMQSLQEKCVHPETRRPYLKSAHSGKDISIAGLQGDFTHAFVCEFENERDRTYYEKEDPAHRQYVESVKDLVSDLRVLEIEPGKF